MIDPDFLRTLFEQPLPGKVAHRQFYPARIGNERNPTDDPKLRMSAVAVVIFNNVEQQPCTLLIQRPTYDGSHSGQISFPGGKWESQDIDLKETALRECFEEIGISKNELEYIGKLTEVYIPVSSFLVEPFVFFWASPNNQLELSKYEVVKLLEFPLSELNDDNIAHISIEIAPGSIIQDVPHFVHPDYKIWGATALMLNELRFLING